MTVDLSGGEEGATFGPPLPSASDKVESPPPHVVSALDRMQARDDTVFVATSMAGLAARHGAALRQAELSGNGSADGFTAQVDDSFSRDVDGIVSQAIAQSGPRPSDSALDLLRRQANGLRQDLTARAAVHEEALRRQQQMQSVLGALDGLHGLVAADPASLHEATKRLDAVTGAAASLVGSDAATQLRDVESRRLTAAAVDGMIAEDPAAALQALSSGAFDHRVDDATKVQLAARATMHSEASTADAERASRQAAIAAEQADADRSFQVVFDLYRRIAAGHATHADVADAESRGALTADQASRLRDQLAASDQARAVEATAAIRVARTLSDGSSLDPSSDADRAAVDAHWRQSVAPTLDANPATDTASTIAEYVNATGIAPAEAVRRLTGQCFDEAPAARVAAARALGDCLRIDPQAGDALPPVIRDAALHTASLAAAGLPPDKAAAPLDRVDLAAPRLQPTSSAPQEALTEADANNGVEQAADSTTGTPTSNVANLPKPAYRDGIPDSDWSGWATALNRAGLSRASARAYQEIFAAEGGSAINPVNGAKSGITKDTLESLVGLGRLPSVPPGTRSRDLTYDQRADAYHAYMDNAFQHVTGKSAALNHVGDDEAAAALADSLFRHGGGRPGNRVIQKAINDVAPGRVAVDGVLRNDTIAAYGEFAREPATKRALLDALAERRMEALKDEAIANLKRKAIEQGKSPDEVDTENVPINKGDIDRVEHFRFAPQPSLPR